MREEMRIGNNVVTVIGKLVSGFLFSHEVYNEKFYTIELAVKRLSEQEDVIPVMVSERIIDINKDYKDCTVRISGQFRSFNRHEDNRNRLILSVFAKEIDFIEEFTDYTKTNMITLDGYVCKPVSYRETPLGREIADILLAVNRPYGKSDYIPCISWGRNSRYASSFDVGTHIELFGRIQSRDYNKAISENDVKSFTAYEVSVSGLEVKQDAKIDIKNQR